MSSKAVALAKSKTLVDYVSLQCSHGFVSQKDLTEEQQ